MPVKFEIYRDGQRVKNFTPVAALPMGPESVPVGGEVTCEDGLLVVNRGDDAAVGLSLLWDMGPLGKFHLETTRLMPREKPYVLNVELCRARLMKIVQKQEDWNLFDFPRSDRFLAKFREAQAMFADALGRLDTPGEAANLADEALAIGMDLSDQLASFHSELLLNRRRATNAFVKHIFGCRIGPHVQAQKLKDVVIDSFDYAVLPMSWKQVQPTAQTFDPALIDEWVETLNKKRVPIIAGPLINLSESEVPEWMRTGEHDFESLREHAYEYVQKIVQRYRKTVAVWNVVAGIQTNHVFSLSFEQSIELTRLLVTQVKNVLPSARTLVTISHPFGEYHARANEGVPPMLYAEMVAQAGVNFEAFSLEVVLGVPAPGMFLRDLFQVSCMLDRFSTLGRPVFITAIGVPGQSSPDARDESAGKIDPEQGGRWSRPWDPQLQAEWMEAVYRIALSKPFVESVAWVNLSDVNPTLPGGGLLDEQLKPKPAYERLQQLRTTVHQWQKGK